jgi:hypothetical protein
VGLGQFQVGNYREFKLREELSGLIEKYNKKFYQGATKPNIGKGEKPSSKESKYSN